MRRSEFEELVRRALSELPDAFLDQLDNVDVLVRRWPTSQQRGFNGIGRNETLLGLYEGVPQTDRAGYNLVLPDTITLFQGPIEGACESLQEVMDQVRATVVHEVAHHFGISDDQLEEWNVV